MPLYNPFASSGGLQGAQKTIDVSAFPVGVNALLTPSGGALILNDLVVEVITPLGSSGAAAASLTLSAPGGSTLIFQPLTLVTNNPWNGAWPFRMNQAAALERVAAGMNYDGATANNQIKAMYLSSVLGNRLQLQVATAPLNAGSLRLSYTYVAVTPGAILI